MKKIIFACLVCVLLTPYAGFAQSLSEASTQLKFAFQELQLRRGDPRRQKTFLNLFPKSAREFNRMFNAGQGRELWDGNQYIFEMEYLTQRNSKQGFSIILGLASELKWGPDAPNYLQFVLMKVAIDNPFEFSNQYLALSESKRKNIVKFLTESKNGPALGYQQLIAILKRVNKREVAKELEAGL